MHSQTIACRPDGSISAVNRRRLTEIPYWFSTNRPDNAVVIPAGQSSDPLSITIPNDGPAEIAALSVSATNPFLARLEVENPNGSRVPLSNGVVHSSNIFGDNLTPYWLPEPLRILEGQRIIVSMTDISTQAVLPNTVRLALHSALDTQQVPDIDSVLYKEIQNGITQIAMPFFLVLDGGSIDLTALQSVEKSIALPDGCSFHLKTITGVSSGAYTLDIIDANTGESIIDAPAGKHYGLANNLIVGTAQFPFNIPFPRQYGKNQKLIIKLVNSLGTTNTVNLCLGGRLIKEYVGRTK